MHNSMISKAGYYNSDYYYVPTKTFCPKTLLSIGLHVSLLEVSSKAVQVLVIRQQGMCFSTIEVRVPHSQHGQDHRNLQKIGEL